MTAYRISNKYSAMGKLYFKTNKYSVDIYDGTSVPLCDCITNQKCRTDKMQ